MVTIMRCKACRDNKHDECDGVKFSPSESIAGKLCNCKCQGIAVAIKKIDKRIASAVKKKKDIQSKCKHPFVTETPENGFWKYCECKVCQKWWTETY